MEQSTRRLTVGLALGLVLAAGLAAPASAAPPERTTYLVQTTFELDVQSSTHLPIVNCWRFTHDGKIIDRLFRSDGRYRVVERAGTLGAWEGRVWLNDLPFFRTRMDVDLATVESRNSGSSIAGTFKARIRGDAVPNPGGKWLFVNGSFHGVAVADDLCTLLATRQAE